MISVDNNIVKRNGHQDSFRKAPARCAGTLPYDAFERAGGGGVELLRHAAGEDGVFGCFAKQVEAPQPSLPAFTI